MTRLARFAPLAALLLATAIPACTSEPEVEDPIDATFPSGKADGGYDEGSPEALGTLALVNDPAETEDALRGDAHVTRRVAHNIVSHRDGPDGQHGTADDDPFDTLHELDAIPYVGPKTLDALVHAARAKGLVTSGPQLSVIFSPQPDDTSSNAELAAAIRGAQHTVDIAIYSYADADIAAALSDAVARGVQVRFLFDTARLEKNAAGPALGGTKSGKLEAAGIDVRWVNKILHHKFLIVDGPRDDKSRAASAIVVMGSANWTATGGGVFDENTIEIQHSAELAAAYQHEFDKLWVGSRDFPGAATPQSASTANITAGDVPDDPGIEALFTSDNFTARGSDGATWTVDTSKMTMADAWVAAIQRAHTSIHIASTHLRMRPVVEALIAKKQAQPDIDIELYLDQQEWLSTTADNAQASKLQTCLDSATTDTERQDCEYNDYLFSKMVSDAGIAVRFKTYSYHWSALDAIQQHSKYMVVDGNELITGSYNLSMNSEHGTFENALHVTGTAYAPLVAAYEHDFATIWTTGRDQLAGLQTQISSDATIPLFFQPIALDWSEVNSLRQLIRANCTAADSSAYRTNPTAHKTCPRS